MIQRCQLTTLILLCVSFLVSDDAFAQKKRKYAREPKNTVLFSPYNAFDFINPSFQLGYERMLTKKLALQVEGGPVMRHSITDLIFGAFGREIEKIGPINKGYRLRGEFKYYMIQRRKLGLYASIEGFYLANKSGFMGTFSYGDPALRDWSVRPLVVENYEQFFYNKKEKYGINLKCGYKFFPRRTGFVLETYIGLGLAHRQNQHAGKRNVQDELLHSEMYFRQLEGGKWMINVPVNFKIGHRF